MKGNRMNKIITKKTNWNEMKELLTLYFSELGYKNDGFHNCMLLEGDAYLIFENDRVLVSSNNGKDVLMILTLHFMQFKAREKY